MILYPLLLACSIERGTVKYLQDPGTALINWTPKISTIFELGKLSKPSGIPHSRLAAERQVYTVAGTLRLVRAESDQDLHVVLADAAGHTIIVEIISPNCANNPHIQSPLSMRQRIRAYRIGTHVEVTGVLFFDFAHGQTGHAPNYVELHPVLSVRKLP